MPKLGMAPRRRKQLIAATVATVDQVGLADATVARIAEEAGLSTGIISHYFGDKGGLIEATMRQLLRELRDAVKGCRAAADATPAAQLKAIVDGNFDESQVSRASMRVWLAFWASSMHEPALARLQRSNDRRLYSNLSAQFRRVLPLATAREAATGLAAMIDGLWLRGSLSPDGVDVAHSLRIAHAYVDHHLQADAKPHRG